MPVQVAEDDFVLFRYRPDYLRDDEGSVTPDEARSWTPPGGGLRTCDINLDGGNVVVSSTRVVLTDKVYKENPKRDRGRLRAELAGVLRSEVVIVPKEPYDVIGHSDGVVRFLDEGRVVVNDYSRVDPRYGPRYGEQLEEVLKRYRLAVERLPYAPTDEVHDGVPSATGCYVNYLRVGRLVVVPAFDMRQDDLACRTLEQLLPGATVVPLRCEGLAREGGVLNCVAWTVRTRRPSRRRGGNSLPGPRRQTPARRNAGRNPAVFSLKYLRSRARDGRLAASSAWMSSQATWANRSV
jgi:agmatine deiminase